MRIGIIGAGAIGQVVGRLLGAAGHEVVVSWSSSDDRLRLAAERIGHGARAATPAEAVSDSDVVIFSPRFEHVTAASKAAGTFLGKVVIDTTNPYTPERDGVLDLGGKTAAQVVSAILPNARYVKGFNTVTSDRLIASAGRSGPERLALFLSGDDSDAKAVAAGLAREAGFDPFDLGGVADSAPQEPGGRYYGAEFHVTDLPSPTGHDSIQCPSGDVVVSARDLKWTQPDPSALYSLAKLWGDFNHGQAGVLLRLPPGFKGPVHAHTSAYRAVIISGEWVHVVTETGQGEGIRLGPGSYYTQQANQMHRDECVSSEPCVFFRLTESEYKTYTLEDPEPT